MGYAYVTVKVPLADHSFINSPGEALALIASLVRRDARTIHCEVELDRTATDRELEAAAWANAKANATHITAEEHRAWIEAGVPTTYDQIDLDTDFNVAEMSKDEPPQGSGLTADVARMIAVDDEDLAMMLDDVDDDDYSSGHHNIFDD